VIRAFGRLRGRKLNALDGEIGSVFDLYFDDVTWEVRYLVGDVGTRMIEHPVLLLPGIVGMPEEHGPVPVDLTREQILGSPERAARDPVTRAYQEQVHAHHGWPRYWEDLEPGAGTPETPGEARPSATRDPHLRSANELEGDVVHARDSEIGTAADFMIEEDLWLIRYLDVKAGGWLLGRHVFIAPDWIERIRWGESSVHVDLDRDAVAAAPPVDPSRPVRREYEEALYRHYSRVPYWDRPAP
jgi:hypothetical protein